MNVPARSCLAALALAALLSGCAPQPGEASAAVECGVQEDLPEKVALAFADGYNTTGRYGLAPAASEDGWLVAVEYAGKESNTSRTGVWFTTNIVSGQIFSVDENASTVSSWGLGEEKDPRQRQQDENYTFAVSCLN